MQGGDRDHGVNGVRMPAQADIFEKLRGFFRPWHRQRLHVELAQPYSRRGRVIEDVLRLLVLIGPSVSDVSTRSGKAIPS